MSLGMFLLIGALLLTALVVLCKLQYYKICALLVMAIIGFLSFVIRDVNKGAKTRVYNLHPAHESIIKTQSFTKRARSTSPSTGILLRNWRKETI